MGRLYILAPGGLGMRVIGLQLSRLTREPVAHPPNPRGHGMSPKQLRLTATAAFVVAVVFSAIPLSAQDSVTVGTVTATSNTVDVPVYVRDVSGTPLGSDQAAGSKIQSFSITVNYAPAAAVQSVTFTRAGITASLSTPSEGSPGTPGSISWF